MIKRGASYGSGSRSWYSGWINAFFPFVDGGKQNKFCVPYLGSNDYIQNGLKQAGAGNDVNKYPYGLASAPVKWKYYELECSLKFIAGFMGVSQDPQTQELSAMVGWVVGEQTKDFNLKARNDSGMLKMSVFGCAICCRRTTERTAL